MESLQDGRLPRDVMPRRYELNLSVEPEAGLFLGSVAIHGDVRRPVRTVVLHAVSLMIGAAAASAKQIHSVAEISFDTDSETVLLAFAQELPVGAVTLNIMFGGRLNQQMKGLYQAKAGDERYAFTQFEATDARRAFPCFDEPDFKASFRITAEIPEDLIAVSNMEVESQHRDPARRRTRIIFKETPPMSTYLVALGVARLAAEELEIDGTRVAIYGRQELSGLTGFAKDVMRACLPMLNDYFGLKYPTSKLDLVGVPDFAMGAMENWGAIFFRENRLLVDVSQASANTLRGVANVITHEVVHQWFGNLVTMWWWDDLWLNEAFATWLACKIVDDWRPEWNSWMEFARDKHVPLGVDALQSTRPISSKVRTAAEAEEMFDALTYEKGASMLRMLEQFLGEEVFRQGIREYIGAHQYANAAAADLWEALAKASGQPVPRIAHDWFTKPGFPMVSLKLVGEDLRRLQIEQHRFMANPDIGVLDTGPWTIPLSLSFEDDAGVKRHRVLMTEARVEVSLPAQGRLRWAYGNANELGYYRTRHAPPLFNALAAAIPRLSPEERFGLLDNTWVLAQKGEVPIGEFLDLAQRFRGSETRIVVEALTGYLETLNDRLVPDSERPRFAQFTGDLLGPLIALLGWELRPGEGDEPKLMRAAALWGLGNIARLPHLLHQISPWLERYWSDPASLDPTLVPPVIRLGARIGDRARYVRYLERHRGAVTPEERDRYVVAFGDFSRPELTPEILGFIMSDEIRGQDLWKPLRVMLANPAVQAEAWTFVKENWTALRQKGGSVGAQRIIGGTRPLWRDEWITDVQCFFTDPANFVPSAERVLSQTLEFMRLGVAFRRLQQERLSGWLREHYA